MAENEKKKGSKWLKWTTVVSVSGVLFIIMAVFVIPMLTPNISTVVSNLVANSGGIMAIVPWLLKPIKDSLLQDFIRERDKQDKKSLEEFKSELAKSLEKYKSELAKSLEKYKSDLNKEQKMREQIALIAEALADWLAADIRNAEDVRQLNKRSFEMTFWLPDDLSKELNDLFAHKGKKEIRDVLFDVRKYMWEDTKREGSKLEPHEIVIFKQKKLISSIE